MYLLEDEKQCRKEQQKHGYNVGWRLQNACTLLNRHSEDSLCELSSFALDQIRCQLRAQSARAALQVVLATSSLLRDRSQVRLGLVLDIACVPQKRQ